MPRILTISHLARTAGVNVDTVRYYQRVGLVTESAKSLAGYRHYPPETVDRICFIKRAQKPGFRLAEISELLELGDGRSADVRSRAEHKRNVIDRQIADLTALRNTLDELIHAYQENDHAACLIVEIPAGTSPGTVASWLRPGRPFHWTMKRVLITSSYRPGRDSSANPNGNPRWTTRGVAR